MISDTVIRGKREGIRKLAHCSNAFLTDLCTRVGFFKSRANKKTEAHIENISEKARGFLPSFLHFFTRLQTFVILNMLRS